MLTTCCYSTYSINRAAYLASVLCLTFQLIITNSILIEQAQPLHERLEELLTAELDNLVYTMDRGMKEFDDKYVYCEELFIGPLQEAIFKYIEQTWPDVKPNSSVFVHQL